MKTVNRSELGRVVAAARAQGERPNLSDADLHGASLSYVDLRDADLWRADLTDAKLDNANLTHANLRGANLTGAKLERAKLRYTSLEGADLSRANLRWAILHGANLPPSALTNSTITDEQWATAKVGPTKVTGDRLKDMRAAATTFDLAELEKYARSRAVGVRMAAASNQACPEELLLKLISDKRDEVRKAVLANPNCTDAVRVMAALQS